MHHSFCKSGVELAGATSSGQTDSGVTAHVFGSLLTRLNDRESDGFFVGTCNDASKLHFSTGVHNDSRERVAYWVQSRKTAGVVTSGPRATTLVQAEDSADQGKDARHASGGDLGNRDRAGDRES